MSWSLSCGDVMPGCTAVLSGATQDDVMAAVSEHVAADHGLQQLDDATAHVIRGKIVAA